MKALINFYATVNENTINQLLNFITQQIHIGTQQPENPLEEIIIQISSSGGSSDHGLLAYNYLQQVNVPKTTIGMGNVDSAAVMIFASGDKRLTMPSCRFLLHEALTTISGQFNGTKLHEIANLNERITTDYCKVISKATDKKTFSVEKKVKEGQVMSSEQAKKYGLAQDFQNEPYVKDLKNLNILIINNVKDAAAPPPKNKNQVKT
ncbi:ATP-dependent Clp protease proteolytic subunit [Patescibacteria group bacterium]|nr:ATP-dependent Clp protease proteolytic subunit [Patescibacteria group bacterium]